ncbi:MAG: acylase [Cellvibrionales bacterium]
MRLWIFVSISVCLSGCAQTFVPADYLALGKRYDVVIERDHMGVPHIIGERDVDAAFGFAYAQSEDNWAIIHDTIAFHRGTNATINGRDAATVDFLVKWLGIWDDLDAGYNSQLAPATRAYVEAFADGLNYYAALHPKDTNAALFPVDGRDIVAGYALRHLLFYGFDAVLLELFEEQRKYPISGGPDASIDNADATRSHLAAAIANAASEGKGVIMNGLPVGSNATAVSPHNSTDGATRLAINSHQPATGPVAWYEAHVQSGEGLNIMGGVFPGGATMGVGFTEKLGWGATVNKPDLVDVYVLDIDPDDPMRYRLDGQWRTLESRDIIIDIKLAGFIPWSVTEEGLRSVHGPVLRTDHGTYAVRYAGMGEIRQVEQWLAMSKANNLEQWRDALRMQTFASFNFVYADRDGNTLFVHNSLTPKRVAGYNWQHYLPGDDSALIWDQSMPFDDLPQVLNPSSGYLHSANQSPFRVTGEGDNPVAADYRIEDGFPTRMTNRADRGLELFAELGTISEDEFFQIKHDKVYSANSRAIGFLNRALDLDLAVGPAHYRHAQQLIAEWDRSTDVDSRGAALSACIIGAEWLAEQQGQATPDIGQELKRCSDLMIAKTGRIDPLWGEVNRHLRGDLNVPVGGGPDTLRAIYGLGMEEDGFLTNVAGDGLYYLLAWYPDGRQKVRGIHQFGAATLDTASPHYADQVQDYADEVLRNPLFDAAERAAHLQRRYRPGQ